MPALLLAFLMAVTMATANVAGFALRAQGLDQRLRSAEVAGVPAARLAAADALAHRWNAEAAVLEAARAQLSAAAGGLTGGLPADVVAGVANLSDAISRAERLGFGTASADAALVAADVYLARPYPD